MENYLDPKNDLIFKKIFGNHPVLLMSFLNSIMGLEVPIVSLEYLSPELVPALVQVPLVYKNSIVDVRCTDQLGRQFLVEMQLYWSSSLIPRTIFNGAKAYCEQLKQGEEYSSLSPVYSLVLVNQIFKPTNPEFIHHFSIMNENDMADKMQDIKWIYVEIPKFSPSNYSDKKMVALWMQFMSISRYTTQFDETVFSGTPVAQAMAILRVGSLNSSERYAYDRHFESISLERSFIDDAEKKGKKEGKQEERKSIALSMINLGLEDRLIVLALGITEEELKEILK